MKTYTIIGGVNGTGKSSLTGVLKTQLTDLGQIIDVDKITAQNGGSAILGGKIALERIRECLDKGLSFTHDIREEDVLRRFAGRWEAVAKVLPYCDEAHFFDNYNGFAEVAEYVNGELIVKGSKLPAWVEELREYL